MRRDIELEFQRLQARDERSSTQPPSKPAETRPATSYTATPQAVVVNSPWDASVHQVERYLKRVLKDPKSYEGIEWSKVVPVGSGFVVRHRYRARNSFGGYVVENKMFVLDQRGEVVEVSNYP